MSEEPVKLSARNRLPGRVTAIKKDGVMAQVDLQVGDNHVVAIITAEAVEDLDLKVGDNAIALIKSTSVMIIAENSDASGLHSL